MGPLEPLLACGATVVALARANSRSKPTKWNDVIAKARASPGTLRPFEQALQLNAAESRFGIDPAKHCLHTDFAASAYMPLPQSLHVASPLAAIFPCSQALQLNAAKS